MPPCRPPTGSKFRKVQTFLMCVNLQHFVTERDIARMAADGRPPELIPEATSSLITGHFPFSSVSLQSFKPLPSYDDRNIYFTGKLEIAAGETSGRGSTASEEDAFVLKLYNRYTTTPAVLDGLNSIMLWLSNKGLPVCCPIASRDGKYEVHCELSDDTYTVKILKFIPGVVMDKLEKKYLTCELAYSVGKLVGNIDSALQDFSHPAIDGRRLEDWDLKYFTDVKQYIPHLRDEEKRKVAHSVVAMYEEHVLPLIPKMKKGIIHDDINGLNILFKVSPDKCELSGLIDFSDCVHSCYLFELAIMLAYGMCEKDNPVQFVGPMFRGYCDVFPLSEEELDCLYYAVLARLCQTAVNGEYRFTLEPWNTYLLTTPSDAWKLMKLLLSLGKKRVEDIWGK